MSEDQKSKDGEAETPDKENQAQNPRGMADGPLKTDLPPTPSNKGGKCNHKKPVHEWVKYFVEIFGILGGLVGLIVLIFQYCEAAKTTKILSGQLKEMQAARTLDERAWVLPTTYSGETTADNNSGCVFNFRYKNTGKTPGLNLEAVCYWTREIGLIPKRDGYPSVTEHEGLCAPGEGGEIQSAVVPAKIMADISNTPNSPIYLFGTIWYDDVFGFHHWSQFCFKLVASQINKNIVNVVEFQTHNSCDDDEANQAN